MQTVGFIFILVSIGRAINALFHLIRHSLSLSHNSLQRRLNPCLKLSCVKPFFAIEKEAGSYHSTQVQQAVNQPFFMAKAVSKLSHKIRQFSKATQVLTYEKQLN